MSILDMMRPTDEQRRERAAMTLRNLAFILGRVVSSLGAVLVEYQNDLPVSRDEVHGPLNQPVLSVASALAANGIDLVALSQTPADCRDPGYLSGERADKGPTIQ